MNIVIPMAGLGERFRVSGFSLPKPLIKIGNKPMYRLAVESLPLHLASKLIFILRQDAYTNKIIDDIKSQYGLLYNCFISVLNNQTEGQAETLLKGSEHLDKHTPVLVHNCDTYLYPGVDWKVLFNTNVDGAMVLFNSKEDKWSFAKLTADRTKVMEVQEKKVISCHASTGTYFFRDTNYLLTNIEKAIENKQKQKNEYYLSTIYNMMIKDHKVIKPLWTDKVLCFGTPSDLVDSINKIISTHSLKVSIYD